MPDDADDADGADETDDADDADGADDTDDADDANDADDADDADDICDTATAMYLPGPPVRAMYIRVITRNPSTNLYMMRIFQFMLENKSGNTSSMLRVLRRQLGRACSCTGGVEQLKSIHEIDDTTYFYDLIKCRWDTHSDVR